MTRLTKSDLIKTLNAKGGIAIPLIHAPDANYALFSLNYIKGEGYEKFKEWLFKRGILGWRHTFDCDNYAEAFIVFLQSIHSKSQKGKEDAKLMVEAEVAILIGKNVSADTHEAQINSTG